MSLTYPLRPGGYQSFRTVRSAWATDIFAVAAAVRWRSRPPRRTELLCHDDQARLCRCPIHVRTFFTAIEVVGCGRPRAQVVIVDPATLRAQ